MGPRRIMERETRYIALVLAVFAVFAVMQVVWLRTDQRPLMSEVHFFKAARLAHGLLGTDVAREYPVNSRYVQYPPLIPLYTAPFLAVFGIRSDVAVLSLLPFALLLMWSTWRIARHFMEPPAAAVAGILVLAFHHFVNIEPSYPSYPFMQEYLLDLPLSALTAFTFLCLVRLADDDSTANRVWLGVALGVGALIRVNYCLALPVMLAALYAAGYRVPWRWKTLRMVGLVAAIIVGPWYGAHLIDMVRLLLERELSAVVAAEYGTPMVFSMAGWLYYPWLLTTMITPPYVIVLVLAIAMLAMHRARTAHLVAVGLFSAYLILSLFYPKNPRLLAPFMFLAAMAPAGLLDLSRRRWVKIAGVVVFTGLALFRIAALHGGVPGHRDASGIVPVRIAADPHPWPYEAIMAEIGRRHAPDILLRVGVNVYSTMFKHTVFQQYALEHGIRLASITDWQLQSPEWSNELRRCEFVVLRDGPDDTPRLSRFAGAVNHAVWDSPNQFILVRSFPLPDGSTAFLYQNRGLVRAWTETNMAPADRPLAVFGESIALAAIELDLTGPGPYRVACVWQALAATPRDCRFAIQYRRGWRVIRDFTFAPCRGLKPPSLWKPGLTVREEYSLPVPPVDDKGPLEVWISWYRGSYLVPVISDSLPVFFRAARVDVPRITL